jgi:hypothetical protein
MTTNCLTFQRHIDLIEINQLSQVQRVLNASFQAAKEISWMEEDFSLQLYNNCQSNMLFIMANCYDGKIDDLINCLAREKKLLNLLSKSITYHSGNKGFNFKTILRNQLITIESILLTVSAPVLMIE